MQFVDLPETVSVKAPSRGRQRIPTIFDAWINALLADGRTNRWIGVQMDAADEELFAETVPEGKDAFQVLGQQVRSATTFAHPDYTAKVAQPRPGDPSTAGCVAVIKLVLIAKRAKDDAKSEPTNAKSKAA